jgi:hypothetical protein
MQAMSRRRIAAAGATAAIALGAAAIVWQMTRGKADPPKVAPRSCWSSPDCNERCTIGDGRACTTLGHRYLGRSRLIPAPSRAAALLDRACEAGDALGCLSLSQLVDSGEGVPRDEKRAKALRDDGRATLESRCDGGDPWSCYDLANALRRGRGVPSEPERAAALATRTLTVAKSECDGGNGRACYLLGRLYEGILDTARDDDAALAAYTRGCDDEDVDACARAVRDREACDLGSPLSCSRVARPFLYGVGEDVDLAEGMRWETRACEIGYAPSCVYMAHAALRGTGVDASMDSAVAFAERAIALYGAECDMGDPSACDYVGDTYDEKPLGRSRSAFEARAKGTALYESSCAGGNAIHCQTAAFRYVNGVGAIVDPAKSDSLLGESCRLGHQGACEALQPPAPAIEDEQSIVDETR